jgi:hypothetical protein
MGHPAKGQAKGQKQIPFGNDKQEHATARAEANAGILRCAQNDNVRGCASTKATTEMLTLRVRMTASRELSQGGVDFFIVVGGLEDFAGLGAVGGAD